MGSRGGRFAVGMKHFADADQLTAEFPPKGLYTTKPKFSEEQIVRLPKEIKASIPPRSIRFSISYDF